ncbi:MAG: formylglycine-generating enzyme family protein, partial [Dehalococcoidia bacterium]
MTLDTPPAIPLLPDLVTVPAGAFWMGDDAGRPDERPARRVWVDAFAVARIPVTNAEFARFLEVGGPVRSPSG